MVLERVKELLAEQLGIDADSITEATDLDADLECDSIDKAELVTTLEDEYDLTVDYDKVMLVKTVGDIVREVESALNK